jgi:hypothetical protein
MSETGSSLRLHKWLFRLTMLATAALTSLVLLTPWLPRETLPRGGLGNLLATFAGDAVVRRTALGGTAGLLVTAFVFFRTPPSSTPRN